jgi:hypothetical protein
VIRGALFVLLLVLPSFALAQERSSEESIARHVFDETPEWEAAAVAQVPLAAPHGTTVCRQGRVVPHSGYRDVHMGCWPAQEHAVLTVPDGVAYLAIRHGAGVDLSWIGGGPFELHDGHTLRIEIDDHETARIAGWVVGAVGVATGIVGLLLATLLAPPGRVDTSLAIVGVVGWVVGLGVGIPLVAWGDGVRATILP